jgi:hypothetical protein
MKSEKCSFDNPNNVILVIFFMPLYRKLISPGSMLHKNYQEAIEETPV